MTIRLLGAIALTEKGRKGKYSLGGCASRALVYASLVVRRVAGTGGSHALLK